MVDPPRSILVIRRDNIGDLLCTTPLFRALRVHYPEARIVALVNSYNAPALRGNVDVDQILVYEKAKHRAAGSSFWRWLSGRWRVYRTLRSGKFDLVLLAASTLSASALKFARLTGAKKIVGYQLPADHPDWVSLPPAEPGLHEVQIVFRLLRALGIDEPPSAMSLTPDTAVRQRLQAALALSDTPRQIIGIHISARKPRQRWPIERFEALCRRLVAGESNHLLIFWAPGSGTNSTHPGDDDKADALAARLIGLPVSFVRTTRLEELIAGLSLCHRVICADGGAMHIAAALHKPLVCLFGNSDAKRWHPWGVPHIVLQSAEQDVAVIAVEQVMDAYRQLAAEQSEFANTAAAHIKN
ncbi:MAG: glycosyltransferase family 9 protein [Candidatus Accumulibacter sp.]|nr:glycosyltransferase family 9 protein [Accumulibacter sp.]